MSALSKPPLPGEWTEDPTTGDKVFTFVCECDSDCGAVYVGRSESQFDLSNIHKPSDLRSLSEQTRVRLDGALSIAATSMYGGTTYPDDFDFAERLKEAVEVYNKYWFGDPE